MLDENLVFIMRVRRTKEGLRSDFETDPKIDFTEAWTLYNLLNARLQDILQTINKAFSFQIQDTKL